MVEKNSNLTVEELATFCKKKGIVFQAAEIYGGLAGFFDFGPLGVEIKNNIKNLYWKKFVNKREDMVGQDGSIITNSKVWKASGHIDAFGDMLLTTIDTKTKLRADHFIEDELNILADGMTPKEIEELIIKNNLKYKGEDFELPIQFFSGMLKTQIGADVSKQSTGYLRPETCQSIFPNFKLIAEGSRMKLPFGIVQIGKAFRNEISPRDFVFRCREFEQMEMEYFFNPETKCSLLTDKQLNTKLQFLSAENQDNEISDMVEVTVKELLDQNRLNEHHAYWLAEFFNFFKDDVGLTYENLRIREHVKTELSHYSSATHDIDYRYPFGFKEMLGMAYRGNYDLTQHQEHSKSKLEYFDEESKTKLLPHVIEPSVGVDRFMMAVLCEAHTDDKERGNVVLNFNNKIAPNKVAIFPLMNKDVLTTPARVLFEELVEEDVIAVYDRSGSIGKRYARQDEVGTPYCITVDYETIEDGKDQGTVTIRDRVSTEQKRINLNNASGIIISLLKGYIKFEELK
ncbi:MAG: glycine--tRNA ligase [Candidatus Woesearchaeota archaeon]|jgi:glycyl-tRNA synthetase|nr:glycine--tRNA ligase [Candidatus Woesearchaeota archaeon]